MMTLGLPSARPEPIIRKEPAPRRKPRRHRRGTVLHFGLWMLLAVVVVIGAFTTYQSIRDNIRGTALRQQLVKAQAVIENAHSYSGIFATGSLLTFLAGEGFSDQELQRVSAGNYIFTSPYDTAITIVGNGARDFTISVANLPQEGCVAALSSFQDSGAGLDSASVGSTAVTVPLTEGGIAVACDNTTNTVNLTF